MDHVIRLFKQAIISDFDIVDARRMFDFAIKQIRPDGDIKSLTPTQMYVLLTQFIIQSKDSEHATKYLEMRNIVKEILKNERVGMYIGVHPCVPNGSLAVAQPCPQTCTEPTPKQSSEPIPEESAEPSNIDVIPTETADKPAVISAGPVSNVSSSPRIWCLGSPILGMVEVDSNYWEKWYEVNKDRVDEWGLKGNVSTTASLRTYLVAYNYVNGLVWAVDKNIGTWNHSTFTWAVAVGNTRLIEWLKVKGCPHN